MTAPKEIKNLIPSPQFTANWTPTNCSMTRQQAVHGLALTNTGANADAFAAIYGIDVSEYVGQSLTFSAQISWVGGDTTIGVNGLLWWWFDGPNQYGKLDDPSGKMTKGRKTAVFTVPSGTTTMQLRLYCGQVSGSSVTWWRPILTPTVDYQLLQNMGMEYFDWSTQPE